MKSKNTTTIPLEEESLTSTILTTSEKININLLVILMKTVITISQIDHLIKNS